MCARGVCGMYGSLGRIIPILSCIPLQWRARALRGRLCGDSWRGASSTMEPGPVSQASKICEIMRPKMVNKQSRWGEEFFIVPSYLHE